MMIYDSKLCIHHYFEIRFEFKVISLALLIRNKSKSKKNANEFPKLYVSISF